MIEKVNSVPPGYHTVTPYLLIKGASDAIAFYVRVFGAEEITRLTAPDGRIGHAEIRIGESTIMIADEHPEMDFLGPKSRGGTTVSLLIYVDNSDDTFNAAYGGQQLIFWNAHYDERGFASMHVYHAGSGLPVATILRPAKTPGGIEVRTVVKHLTKRIRKTRTWEPGPTPMTHWVS